MPFWALMLVNEIFESFMEKEMIDFDKINFFLIIAK